MISDVEAILKVNGLGMYLHFGCGDSSLVFQLLKRGANAFGIDQQEALIQQNLDCAPGRFLAGSLQRYPFPEQAFDTIIIGKELLSLDPATICHVLEKLRNLTKANLVLYFPETILAKVQAQPTLMKRLVWEKLALAAGFRFHPRSMLVNEYVQLENESLSRFIFLERIPEAAYTRYSLAWLAENRDLHMDMLREAGRRSEAHIVRYVQAAKKVRPNDIVLDVACGLGYGTAVLAACSPGKKFIGVDLDPSSTDYATSNFTSIYPNTSFHASCATKLSFIPDHSIDTVVSFETIEHLPDYELFLAEVKRVLRPDGRFIGSVPNLWCDETGNDPNPHHFHVFDWKKLEKVISRYFIVEERIAQSAGGGFKNWQGKRELYPVPLNATENYDPEWWLITACMDPRAFAHIPYVNQYVQSATEGIPSIVDFAKYYDNPWLYRTMVQLGERISDRETLIQFCQSIINSARPGSADLGAALCVISYQMLEYGSVNTLNMQQLIDAINIYDQDYDKNNVHAYRWAISLHFVGARLLMLYGNQQEALQGFLACANMDPAHFSPLLATKTIAACHFAGLLYVCHQRLDEAKAMFKKGVVTAQTVLQGDWETILGNTDDPLLFGLQEAAEVADIASQCAQAFAALQAQGNVPGFIWDKANLKRFGIVEWTKSVEIENARLRQQVGFLNSSMHKLAV